MATFYENQWMNIRLAIAAALIIGTMFFYFGYWFAMWRREGKKSYIYMNEIASKFYLFGIAALFSINYFQTGIFQAIMTYLTLFGLLLLVGAALLPDSVDDKKRTFLMILYYFLLFIWYIGIMIDYYVENDN